LQNSSPHRLEFDFVGQCESSVAALLERRSHEILARHRMSGEWFNIDIASAVAAVMEAAADLKIELVPYDTPKPTFPNSALESPVVVQIRVTDAQLAAVDAWRRKQADPPTRSEAIRRLIEAGLNASAK
jgi:hypothetical protein